MFRLIVLFMVVAALVQTTSAFSSPIISVATTTTAAASPSKASSSSSTAAASAAVAAASSNPKALLLPLEPKNVVNCVAVAGATGRTGRVVVQELLARGIKNVVALTRDETYAAEIFPDPAENLQLLQCDLSNDRQLQKALEGVDAVIWCATGFSNKPNANPFQKMKGFLDLALKKTIDVTVLPKIAEKIKDNNNNQSSKKQTEGYVLPKVVMLSSAGVTRTIWDENKKALMPGAADIPIVRLNPFGALDIKRESEEKLRQTGVDYAVVRPCGLNDNHPAGSRPLFSQGDVAVGRINRKDVAKLLVDCLASPQATGKTFEVISVAGYQPAASVDGALANLRSDKEGLPPMDAILSTYTTLQQLLPGETQNSAALAMGQTYEQLDKNEEGRLGPRGRENAFAAAPKPSS